MFGLEPREDLGLVRETLLHEQLHERARFGARQIVVRVIAIVHLAVCALGGEPTISRCANRDSDLGFGRVQARRVQVRQ